jgi:hypothetical protein
METKFGRKTASNKLNLLKGDEEERRSNGNRIQIGFMIGGDTLDGAWERGKTGRGKPGERGEPRGMR